MVSNREYFKVLACKSFILGAKCCFKGGSHGFFGEQEKKMAHLRKPVVLLVVLVIALSGCQQQGKAKTDDISVDELGREKSALFTKIDRKYENPKAHYELGKLYYNDGLWDKAEWEFNIVLGFDPAHRRAQAALVKTFIAADKPERSQMAAEFYINQASTSASSSLLLGKAFQRELLDDYAVACYQQALGLAPNSAALHKQIGYYYLSKRDQVRAEEYLRRSFQLDPYQAEVAGELGRLGIVVQIPRKVEKNTKKLDKLINDSKEE